jgi:hypothetical protein
MMFMLSLMIGAVVLALIQFVVILCMTANGQDTLAPSPDGQATDDGTAIR